MNQEQTACPSTFQQVPKPTALVPAAGETQKVCVSPREPDAIDVAILGYN